MEDKRPLGPEQKLRIDFFDTARRLAHNAQFLLERSNYEDPTQLGSVVEDIERLRFLLRLISRGGYQ